MRNSATVLSLIYYLFIRREFMGYNKEKCMYSYLEWLLFWEKKILL